MNHIVISGDIVSSTSLNTEGKAYLLEQLQSLVTLLKTHFNCYSRIIKGDYLESVVPQPQDGLQVLLAIKCFVKAIELDTNHDKNEKAKFFEMHGIRLAMGFGSLERFDIDKGIIDGEAIYRSGRLISAETTHNKKRIVIKNTLFFSAEDEQLTAQISVIFNLIDTILANATSRQCQVLFQKLIGKSEDTIAQHLGIGQSTVNRHSTSAGWNSIDSAVQYFSNLFKTL